MFDDTMAMDKVSTIVIDLGLKLTKVGYGAESEPRSIIKTPMFFDYEKYMVQDTQKHFKETEKSERKYSGVFNNTASSSTSLLAYKKDIKILRMEIEEFVYTIFYTILQLKKQQRDKNFSCLLAVDFYISKHLQDVYELLVKNIFENPQITLVKLVPKAILPIFATGYSSGIMIDVGYLFTTICPINNGFPYMDKCITLSIGTQELERTIKRFITEDNGINTSKTKIKNVEQFSTNIIQYLDDLVVRSALCLNKKMSNLIKDTIEESRIKNDFSKVDFYKDVQDFQLNLLSRIKLGEKFFGDVEEEEFNIAYSLLEVISKIPNEDRKKLCQNILICGGGSMITGFYKRLVDEVNSLLEIDQTKHSAFSELHLIKNYIKFHKVIFPRNCLTWIGGSLISNYEKISMKNLTITKEDIDNEIQTKISPVAKILNNFK